MREIIVLANKRNNNDEIIDRKSADVENFPVFFKRAVCIHSSLQFLDLFMQSLMFSHGFSATPVIPMRVEKEEDEEEERLSKTLIAFEKIRNEFREIFRSRHRNTISEVMILVGTCPIRSTYSYRVPIKVCEAEDSTHESCGDTCAELNDGERRKINRDLFMLRQSRNTPEYEKQLLNQNHRLFVFLKGSDEMVNEEIEEEEPPTPKTAAHRQYTFSHENCNCCGISNSRNSDGKWLRMVPFIVHTKF